MLRQAAQSPASTSGALKRLSGRWFVARPDQVVRAVFFLDQSRIDGRRQRRVIQTHRQVGPLGLADSLPRRADFQPIGALDAEIRGVVAALVVGDKLEFDTLPKTSKGKGAIVCILMS